MMEVGQKVRVHYRGTLDDGREFDNSYKRGEPLELVIGSRRMMPAFEKAVAEMSIGEVKHIHVPAREAYGVYDKSLVETVPVSAVPNANALPVGQYIIISTPSGSLRVKVLKIEENLVIFDKNHELADRDVDFDIELIEVVHETAIEQEKHALGCGCGCDRLKKSLGRQAHDKSNVAGIGCKDCS